MPPPPTDSLEPWKHCTAVVRPALLLASRTYLEDVRERLAEAGIQAAVADRDTATIYNWIVSLLDRQGISNASAIAFAEKNGGARWLEVTNAIAGRPLCQKLSSYWHYADCGFRKDARNCSRPDLMPLCPVPALPARKGALSQAAVSLALFIRDVCDGDIVAWIDARLAAADLGPGVPGRAGLMRGTLLDPLANIAGTGPKVWSMILAELLLGADPQRERWVTTGASFVAIDSLVHAYLHRTGILRRLDAQHPYGPACHGTSGCAGVIERLAARIDAREFNASFPKTFPRWVQFAIWSFGAEGGLSICNGRQIDDREGCRQAFCPVLPACDKIVVKPSR